jgi:WhiB family redox-sensing transcriptional regulator
VSARPEWRDRALCLEYEPAMFFPDSGDKKGIARAQMVCRACPVLVECRQYAQEAGERYGIWAGEFIDVKTEADRRWQRSRNGRENKRRARERRAEKVLTEDESAWLQERYG